MTLSRRTFLRSLSGLFVAAAAAPVVEPVRKLWQVSADAPVASREPLWSQWDRAVEQMRRDVDERLAAGQLVYDAPVRLIGEHGHTLRADGLFGIDASSYPEWRHAKFVPVSGSQAALYHEYEMHRQRLLEAAADQHAFDMRDAINAIPKDRLAEAWKVWQERNG